MQVEDMFVELVNRMTVDPTFIEKTKVVYEFNIIGENGGLYQLVLKDGKPRYMVGNVEEASIVIELSDENFIKMANGELNPTVAYMSGKLRVKGDLSQALALQSIIKHYQS